jgi:hypothetical protein
MKIKNVKGTSESTCKCGSWFKHWEKFSGQTATYCPVTGCYQTDLVGAHVQKANSTDTKRYIYPLCNSHNKSADELEVSDHYKLVSANKKETCEK